MTPNELRIGNGIVFSEDGTEFEVAGIFTDGLNVKNSQEETYIEIDAFEPIVITNEKLSSLGLIKQKDGSFYNYEIGFQSIQWQQENPFIKIDFHSQLGFCIWKNNILIKSNLKFVHKLQNLYFEITNQELTFKP